MPNFSAHHVQLTEVVVLAGAMECRQRLHLLLTAAAASVQCTTTPSMWTLWRGSGEPPAEREPLEAGASPDRELVICSAMVVGNPYERPGGVLWSTMFAIFFVLGGLCSTLIPLTFGSDRHWIGKYMATPASGRALAPTASRKAGTRADRSWRPPPCSASR